MGQDAFVDKGIITSDVEVTCAFAVHSLDEAKVLLLYFVVLIVVFRLIWSTFIRLDIIIAIILTFDSGFVEHLRRADVVFAPKATS
jgi:energy-coupling factor transporter transmembrane protein EcfT